MVNEHDRYTPWQTALHFMLLGVFAVVCLCFLLGLRAPAADVAPPPRPVLSPEGDLRSRVRVAFAFEAAKARSVKPTEADRTAVKNAFEEAARTLAASKLPRPKDSP